MENGGSRREATGRLAAEARGGVIVEAPGGAALTVGAEGGAPAPPVSPLVDMFETIAAHFNTFRVTITH